VDPTTEALPEPGGTGRRRGQATREVRKGGVEGEGRLLGGGEVTADRWRWWKPAVGREVGARKGGRQCERKTACMLGPWAGNAVEGKVMMVGPMLGSSAVGTRGSRVCLNGRALSAVKKSLFQHGRKNVSSRFHLVIKNKKAIRHQQRQRWSAGLTKPPPVGFRGSKKTVGKLVKPAGLLLVKKYRHGLLVGTRPVRVPGRTEPNGLVNPSGRY
jgi:hypothetical protein